MALLGNNEQAIPPMQLAKICQSAENDFVGARCGLMDQFIATHGMRDHALMLNCATLDWQPIPLPASHRWAVANTMVRHSLASGEYNARRAEVEELQSHLRQWFPQHRYLHQLSSEEMEHLASRLSSKLARRLRHVVSENRRVSDFVLCLQTGNMRAAGATLAASHRSLREDFEVSCRELDVMVELASQLPGVLGARMLGGGFGGCVLALIEEAHVETSIAQLRSAYRQETGLDPWLHVCDIEQAARRMDFA
jgi:galactokinase